jgi:hypothetical protein
LTGTNKSGIVVTRKRRGKKGERWGFLLENKRRVGGTRLKTHLFLWRIWQESLYHEMIKEEGRNSGFRGKRGTNMPIAPFLSSTAPFLSLTSNFKRRRRRRDGHTKCIQITKRLKTKP